jgi:hypothetical protein
LEQVWDPDECVRGDVFVARQRQDYAAVRVWSPAMAANINVSALNAFLVTMRMSLQLLSNRVT